MWIVYKISNYLNDKTYIGITSLSSAYSRWEKHKENCNQLNDRFHVAISRLGSGSFDVEEIDYCESEYEAYEHERHWINYYDSFNSGYNSTLGGEGVRRSLNDEDVTTTPTSRKGPDKEFPLWAFNDAEIRKLLTNRFPVPCRELAGRMARIIYLYYRLDMVLEDVAIEVGATPKAVRALIHRVNKAMREPLKPPHRPKKYRGDTRL